MNPLLVDTHAHVNFNAFKNDGDAVIQRALDEGTWVVNVGSQIDTSRRAVEYAGHYPEGVYAVVGLHPVHLFSQHIDEEEFGFDSREEKFDYEAYKTLAKHEKVIGIGECGLEYFHLPDSEAEEIKRTQKDAFIQQIELASELKKALMVHSRDAYQNIYEILRERRKILSNVIIHSFIGNWEEAKKFLDLGCYISFNGIITFKPRKEKTPGASDPELLEAVKNIPLERMVLETDCPYLAPAIHRGERNEPSYVKFTAEKIAEIKNISFDEVARQTTQNARTAFAI
ncbi:MAG: TatD family hydrolase [bacterium]|nr:TatD family hydrolase [bacterium]